ncbi:hypothetical protein [Microtetraspora malaysiensis]|uniref:hypothetical protein n=1 Tax=Microtetraspora malaysiensis TaxID=161358 RepID=UPI003D8D2580
MATSLVVRPDEIPVLDVLRTTGRPVRVRAVRRAHGWAFTWRPSWSRFWRQGEWVWALDAQAAERVMSAMIT